MTATPTPADEKVPGLREALEQHPVGTPEADFKDSHVIIRGDEYEILRQIQFYARCMFHGSESEHCRDTLIRFLDDLRVMEKDHAPVRTFNPAATKSAPQDAPADMRERLSALEDEVAAGKHSSASVLTRVRSWFDLSAPQEPNEWQRAVINALIVNHIYTKEHDTDALKALADLVQWEVQMALDPKVSAAARALQVRAQEASRGDYRVTSTGWLQRLDEVGNWRTMFCLSTEQKKKLSESQHLFPSDQSKPQEAQVAVGDDLIKLLRDAQDCVWAHWKGERFPRDWEIHEALRLTADRLSATPPREVAAVEPSVMKDANRYQRLRVLGAAPGNSKNLEAGTVLRFQSLDAFIDEDISHYPSRGEVKHTIAESPARQGGAVVQSKNDYERLIIRESTARERFKDMGLPYSSWDAFWIGYHEGNTHAESPSLPVSVMREALACISPGLPGDFAAGMTSARNMIYNRLASHLPESSRHLLLGGKS